MAKSIYKFSDVETRTATPQTLREEYRLVRACLHPDRAPEDRKPTFTKAFDIFTRLEKSVNRDMPIELRKKHGWS